MKDGEACREFDQYETKVAMHKSRGREHLERTLY